MLTQERLKEVLRYCEHTGVFTWRVDRGCRKAGSEAGFNSSGYRRVKIDGRQYPLHRLTFLYINGTAPAVGMDVDHINRDKADNRFSNLRIVTRSGNALNTGVNANNKLKASNVRRLPDTGKYQVRVKGKSYGCYPSLKEAQAVADAAMFQAHQKETADG